MHVLLRPADRRAHAGMRESVSDGVDSVRTARTNSTRARRNGSPISMHEASQTRRSTTRWIRRSAESTPSSAPGTSGGVRFAPAS